MYMYVCVCVCMRVCVYKCEYYVYEIIRFYRINICKYDISYRHLIYCFEMPYVVLKSNITSVSGVAISVEFNSLQCNENGRTTTIVWSDDILCVKVSQN